MAKRRTTRETPTLKVSSKDFGGVSEYRQEQLSNEIESGTILPDNNYVANALAKKVGGASAANAQDNFPKVNRGQWMVSERDGVSTGGRNIVKSSSSSELAVGALAHSSYFDKKGFSKIASSIGSSGTSNTSGSNVERMAPEVYSPLFTMANLILPRDRITVNAWVRNFFQLHPIVRNAITLHATYPISKLNLKCSDRKVLQFFEDMVEELDFMTILGDVALEYWKMGEAIVYSELNESSGKWDNIIIQNPDYINIRKSVLSSEPIILLRPDSKLQQMVMSNNPADVQLRKQIPEKILYHIRNGQLIPLDNFNVSHLKMLAQPYDVRGTSIIVSVFKDLALYDKIRECKFAQADGMVNPITLVKIGGNEDGEYRATQEDIEFFRQMLEEAQYDKDFKLITHAGVKIERVGYEGAVLNIAEDMNLIIKNIYTGLMVPPAVVDTESAVYASASIGLEVLRQRYFNFRAMMAKWLVKKIFAPISEIQEFYEFKGGKKKLIVPEVEWNQMNLYDLQDYIGNITGLVGAKQASLQTLYRSLGLNYEEERVRMRQEAINDAVRRKEEEALSKMTLTELRGLDPEKEILEPIDDKERAAEAIPPEAAGGMPGEMPPMGGAPGGMGGLPGGLPELAPPPGGELTAPGGPGGAPGPGELGPGTPGGPKI